MRNANLRAAREAVGFTRGELAVACGISARMVEALEVGECGPSPATGERLERALLRAAPARLDRIEDAVSGVARLDAAVVNNENGRDDDVQPPRSRHDA